MIMSLLFCAIVEATLVSYTPLLCLSSRLVCGQVVVCVNGEWYVNGMWATSDVSIAAQCVSNDILADMGLSTWDDAPTYTAGRLVEKLRFLG
jgi:hypothetical protein